VRQIDALLVEQGEVGLDLPVAGGDGSDGLLQGSVLVAAAPTLACGFVRLLSGEVGFAPKLLPFLELLQVLLFAAGDLLLAFVEALPSAIKLLAEVVGLFRILLMHLPLLLQHQTLGGQLLALLGQPAIGVERRPARLSRLAQELRRALDR
jgi:hypothetical protein